MEAAAKSFLARFVGRGWLSAERDDPLERAAVKYGVAQGWLTVPHHEARFTAAGRQALSPLAAGR